MIKLFFSDLDGTLWRETAPGEFETRPEDLAAVRRLVSAGVRFAVATGRGLSAGEEIRRRAGLERLDMVGANGSTIYVDGEMVDSQAVSSAEIVSVMAAVGPVNTRMMFETVSHGLLGVVLGERDDVIPPKWREFRTEDRAYLEAHPDLRAYKLTIIVREEDLRQQILAAIAPLKEVRALVNQLGFVEVIPAAVSKGAAIGRYCARMGYNMEDVAFIGDETNDVEAMEAAGMSFCMAAARPEIRQHADFVAENVAEAIEKALGSV